MSRSQLYKDPQVRPIGHAGSAAGTRSLCAGLLSPRCGRKKTNSPLNKKSEQEPTDSMRKGVDVYKSITQEKTLQAQKRILTGIYSIFQTARAMPPALPAALAAACENKDHLLYLRGRSGLTHMDCLVRLRQRQLFKKTINPAQSRM